MIAINIQETTTTTGTGSVTLSGASEFGKTLASEYIINERFSYYIDDRSGNWEHGIGYLSGATTLVRETLIASSTGAIINFGAGEKQVINGATSGIYPTTPPSGVANTGNQLVSDHLMTTGVNTTMSVGRIYYIPFVVRNAAYAEGIGITVRAAVGTSANAIHLGLYCMRGDYYPLEKMFTGDDLDPSITGFQVSSFAKKLLKPGEYFIAIWSDVAAQVEGVAQSSIKYSGLGFQNSSQAYAMCFRDDGNTGLLTLPVTANQSINTTITGGSIPLVFLELSS